MKKLLVLVALLPCLAFAGSTTDGRLLVAPDHPNRFTCALNGLAASLTQCQAAPAAATTTVQLRYYITDVVVQTTTATSGTWSIQSGTGTNCATATTAVLPVSNVSHRFNAPINSQPLGVLRFATPLAVTAGHAICVIGTATNTISIQISGYLAP